MDDVGEYECCVLVIKSEWWQAECQLRRGNLCSKRVWYCLHRPIFHPEVRNCTADEHNQGIA